MYQPGDVVPTRRDIGRRRVLPMAGVFFVVAFLAAGMFGAAQPATGIPAEVIQLAQFGPASAVAVVALCWPRRTRALLAGTFGGPGGAGARPADARHGAAHHRTLRDGVRGSDRGRPVHPPGGPTTVTMEIPCALSSPKTSFSSATD